ncbi:MAG: retropepsin-like aspartic protease [Lysobacterales bacterium]
MKLVLRDSLMFVPVTLSYGGATLQIDDILVDTGSTTTLLSIDCVASLGIHPEASDSIRRIRGVGGVEYVFSRRIDAISIAGQRLMPVELEFGGLDYGFQMNGILGLDVLLQMGAVLDLKNLTVEFPA